MNSWMRLVAVAILINFFGSWSMLNKTSEFASLLLIPPSISLPASLKLSFRREGIIEYSSERVSDLHHGSFSHLMANNEQLEHALPTIPPKSQT